MIMLLDSFYQTLEIKVAKLLRIRKRRGYRKF